MRISTLILALTLLPLPFSVTASPAEVAAAPKPSTDKIGKLPPAADTFTVGSLKVQRFGDNGRALILIPGLGSGAWVWHDTINHYSDDHTIYALTLAGFNGMQAPEQDDGLMALAASSLQKLINEHHINKPVLIGHSLGGTLALEFATEHSDLISGVVAVDGMPVFPGSEKLSTEQRAARASMMQARMAGVSQEQFAAQQLRYMQTMGVLDPELALATGALQAKSDPAAVAAYMAEDFALDLRPKLDDIEVPVLEISPYNEPDFKRAAASGIMPMFSEAQKTAYYRGLLEGVADLKVVSISPARHFVMLDRPQEFLSALDTFLGQP